MPAGFDHCLAELSGVAAERLDDVDALAALIVSAASASGISPGGLPLVRRGPQGSSVALVCLDGHLVMHAAPARGGCLVDIVVRSPGSAARGLDVIARRLGVQRGSAAALGQPPELG
ncbi:MAG TPA: S-adenosylmethionine decarboxylase [Gemmatimonadales bacterium]|jgi:S-adenosylmethionine/arginine decarboxylase-like enzyme|nr:S-adenosylmethionine decarboxylase [Gemmatimonadales bacterium]